MQPNTSSQPQPDVLNAQLLYTDAHSNLQASSQGQGAGELGRRDLFDGRLLYSVVAQIRPTVRDGPELSSNNVGQLAPGELVEVHEERAGPNGFNRLRVDRGWVSSRGQDGTELLQPVASANELSSSWPENADGWVSGLNSSCPLPSPLPDKCTEAATGSCCIIGITVLCLITTHIAVLYTSAPNVFLVFVYLWAVIAMACLYMIQAGADPGVISRSVERSLPLPPGEVRDLLRAGIWPLPEETKNVRFAACGTYCVRCLVWRWDSEFAHHCSTCGRCVKDFDHHCGVLGRCIAGSVAGGGGNMLYFTTLLLMLPVGTGTAFLACVYPHLISLADG